MTAFPWITALTILPLLGAVTLLAGGTRAPSRRLALAFSFAALAAALGMAAGFDRGNGALQMLERHSWIPALAAEYKVGIDGLGLVMVVLSAAVVLMGMLASKQITQRQPLYYALLLLLESCLFGTFTALNFLHWFIFWELSLIPAFFLIKLWGGPRSTRAATEFLVYTMTGSVAMLLAFLVLFLAAGTFDFAALADFARSGALMPAVAKAMGGHLSPERAGTLVFLGAFLGFAVKVPVYPFHSWLPATYAEAPTGTTIVLTGAMSKMGLYGFLRILLPIFAPQMQSLLTPLLWMAVASIVLSAFSALAQKDLKLIFAYSSINHLGYCILGILAVVKSTSSDAAWIAQRCAALDGVILQMVNHALTAGLLFWFIALLEARGGGLRSLDDFGGLRKVVPVFTGLMGIALFSSLGLPGLNGFPGEVLIFKGSFPLVPWATCIAIVGLMITAIFILRILQTLFSGPLNPAWAHMPDLTRKQQMLIAPAIAAMFGLGLYPRIVVGAVNATVLTLVHGLKI
jgi:NADH-quinone oxidoreductase subunit M